MCMCVCGGAHALLRRYCLTAASLIARGVGEAKWIRWLGEKINDGNAAGAWWVAAARWGLWLYLSFINVVNVVDGGVKRDEEKFANTGGRMDGEWMVDGWWMDGWLAVVLGG